MLISGRSSSHEGRNGTAVSGVMMWSDPGQSRKRMSSRVMCATGHSSSLYHLNMVWKTILRTGSTVLPSVRQLPLLFLGANTRFRCHALTRDRIPHVDGEFTKSHCTANNSAGLFGQTITGISPTPYTTLRKICRRALWDRYPSTKKMNIDARRLRRYCVDFIMIP